MKKSLVIMVVFMICVLTTAPLKASPLYGGYNGESDFWVDVYFFGIDDQMRWWVRIPMYLAGGELRVNLKYEHNGERKGVISAEIAIAAIFEEGTILFGADTSGLTWNEFYEPSLLTTGSDRNGTNWTEQNRLQIFGTGSDSNGHSWGYVTIGAQTAFPIKVGISLSSPEPEPEPEPSVTSNPFLTRTEQNALPSLTSFLREDGAGELINFLASLSVDDELRRDVAFLDQRSLDMKEIVEFADEKVFTQERKEVIEGMINSFIKRKGRRR